MVEHIVFERLHQSEANVRQDLYLERKAGLIASMDKNYLSKDYLNHRTQHRHQSCRRLSTIPYLLVFYVTLCFVSTLDAVVGLENGDNSHQRDNFGHSHKKSTAKKPVTVMWGVADTTATMGMIFKYRIPKDAFKGDVDHFEVTEAGKKTLPRWLNFDNKTNTFIGVPTNKNAGQHYISVIAKGASSSKAKDVFSINVVEDGDQPSGTTRLKESDQANKRIICRPDETLTVVSVIIDVDIDSLSPLSRIDLLSKMKESVLIEEELLKVLPLGGKAMYDGSAVMAGPGNSKMPQTTISVISWQVGCGGNVDADHIPSLTAMESSALDGSMAETLGIPVIGWQVTTTKPPLTKRQKRQLSLMATAVPQPDEYVVPTRYEPNTDTIDTSEAAEDSVVPDSRIIPTMTSPSFPGEKTKNHRPEKTRGRHHSHKHKTDHITPTKSHPHLKSKAYHLYTPLHTPLIIPTQPTKLPAMTLIVTEDDFDSTHDYSYHVTPTLIMPTATPTFVDSRIQPSIQPTATYITHPGPTEPTPSIPTKKTKPPKKTTPGPTTHTPRTQSPVNHHPVLVNAIDHINAVIGEVLRYRIPFDTFKDHENGDTTRLKLVFLSIDGTLPSKSSWVQFNSTSQELYGLPLKGDDVRKEYLLAAIDGSGASVRDVFSIQVHKIRQKSKVKLKFNHKFTVKLGNNFENFTSDAHNRVHLTEKIASYFGDPDASHMYVQSITRGSTIFAWSNYSLPQNVCHQEQIQKLMDLMIKNGDVNPEFKQALKPEFIVEKADLVPLETCFSSVEKPKEKPTSTSDDDSYITTIIPADKPAEKPKENPTLTSDDDIYITTVIPAVVIAAMLIIAALIACILYRKKRKGKLSDEDKHTFINKGIPIIFADELEEKSEKPSKSPVILKDEKPPLPPPEYPRSSASSSNPSTPPSDRKDPIETTEDEHDPGDVNTSPPYQPPPPFTTNRENRQSRPKHQPTYRLPPPYVPP